MHAQLSRFPVHALRSVPAVVAMDHLAQHRAAMVGHAHSCGFSIERTPLPFGEVCSSMDDNPTRCDSHYVVHVNSSI